jgi:hypothetical protein
MQVTPTGAFLRSRKKLSVSDAEDTTSALELFLVDPQAKALNFEKVKSRKGYFTIRANFSTRVLLREVTPQHYEVAAVGNHDYIYENYFKRR